jgi:divalent metal cation (Fe/Co/Zn/Cd) transporter
MSVATSPGIDNRAALIRQAFRLEYITLAWMTVEVVVAVYSGIAAGSLTLIAFGIDSIIELASAGVLLWRLNVELRRGQDFAESAERKASRIGAVLLFALATYVVASAGWKLWTQQGAEFSAPGLILVLLAIPIMYFLSRRKLKLAARFGLMRWRASPVAGWRLSWWAPSLPSFSSVHGGSTPLVRWQSSGS